MKTINLENILLSKIPEDCYWESMGNLTNCPKEYVIEAMKEACKQALELAAENAILTEEWEDGKKYEEDVITIWNEYNELERLVYPNKDSILKTIEQIV